MRLIVELDDEFYNHIQNDHEYFLEDGEELYSIVQNATPIPDNASNLDVFVSVFKGTPDISTCPVFCISKDDVPCQCDVNTCECGDWWNAPYKKGEEE